MSQDAAACVVSAKPYVGVKARLHNIYCLFRNRFILHGAVELNTEKVSCCNALAQMVLRQVLIRGVSKDFSRHVKYPF